MKHVVDIGRWSVGFRSVLFVVVAGLALMSPGGSFLRPVMGQDEPKADAAAPAGAAAEEPAAAAEALEQLLYAVAADSVAGHDGDQPAGAWEALDDAMTAEDHPQYRYRRLMEALARLPMM